MADDHPHQLPGDPTLAEAATALERGRLAGEVLDAEWRLRYVSGELRNLLGVFADEELGYGTPALARAARLPDVWRLDERSQAVWWRLEAPYVRDDLSDLEVDLREMFGALAKPMLSGPRKRPPAAWAGSFETTFPDGSPARVGRLVVRLHRPGGGLAGLICVYVGGGLRGSVQAMLSRGDDAMFERMASLTRPARRPAAILFVDLEASGVLSRRLSTRAYFELIQELTAEIDGAVIEHGGIVGKHAGDGVSAFFLAEQCGGETAAAAAGLLAIHRVQRRVARIDSAGEPLAVNAGLHWGATLVIGQVVTGGRLEVTALGDEVNEAARLQEVARGGRALVTKDVIERIDAGTAAEIGVDPERTSYTILGEIPEAGEKARRDAGGLACAELPAAG